MSVEETLRDANRLFLKKRFRDAITLYDAVLATNPKQVIALNNKGYSLGKLKDHERAILCYDEALQITPDDKTLLINKISSLRKTKRYEEAIKYCDQILEKNAKDAITLYHKERILHSSGDYKGAISCCDVILERHPGNGDVLFDKSTSLAMLDSADSSLDALDQAIRESFQFKIKARGHKAFAKLCDDPRFLQLVSD